MLARCELYRLLWSEDLKGRELLADFRFQGWIILKCDLFKQSRWDNAGGLTDLIKGCHDEEKYVMN